VVNIVYLTLAILKTYQILDGTNEVVITESNVLLVNRGVDTQFAVHLVTTNQTKIVAAGIKKHLVEKGFGIFQNGWLSWSDFLVEVKDCFFGIRAVVF